MLKEAFAILTQGIEILHYDRKTALLNGYKTSKIVWLDTDTLRLCVDTYRPTIEDRKSGKVPPGVYMRDVSDIRGGANAYDFKFKSNSADMPTDEFCLHIVATERTLCFEFPSEYVCSWFLERFHLLLNDVRSIEENIDRLNRWILPSQGYNLQQTIDKDAEHLAGVFKRGMQVRHHDPSGHINSAIVMISNKSNSNNHNNSISSSSSSSSSGSTQHQRITVYPTPSKSIFSWLTPVVSKPMGLDVSDIVEVRVGSHSFNFLATKSVGHKDDLCVSIIGTECTLDIEFTALMPRDIFVEIMRNYLIHYHQQHNPQQLVTTQSLQEQQQQQQPRRLSQRQHKQEQEPDGYNNHISNNNNNNIVISHYRRKSLNDENQTMVPQATNDITATNYNGGDNTNASETKQQEYSYQDDTYQYGNNSIQN